MVFRIRIEGNGGSPICKSVEVYVKMLHPVLWNMTIPIESKNKLIVHLIIEEILLYAVETWTVSSKIKKRKKAEKIS